MPFNINRIVVLCNITVRRFIEARINELDRTIKYMHNIQVYLKEQKKTITQAL